MQMKGIFAVLLIAASGLSVFSEESYRSFTSLDEQSIEARILDYNAARKTIQLETSSGKKAWVKPSNFCEEDQVYIREWIAADLFMNEATLHITAKKHKKSQGKKGDNVHYTISFKNRGDIPFDGLKAKGRLYVKGHSYTRAGATNSCRKVNLEISSIPAASKVVCETDPELMKEEYVTSTTRYTEPGLTGTHIETSVRKTREYSAMGLWIRLIGPKLNGVPVIRDVCFPADLAEEVSWQENAVTSEEEEAKTAYLNRSAKDLLAEGERYAKGKGVSKDMGKALKFYEAAYAKEPTMNTALSVGEIYLNNRKLRDLDLAEKWLGRGGAQGCNQLAWFYSTTKIVKLRDGEKAVKYAKTALSAGENNRRGQYLGTLACAYARIGEFDLAVKAQEKAYIKAKSNRYLSAKSLEGEKIRLELFKQGKAWPVD